MFPVCKENKADKVYGNVEMEDISDNFGISVYLPMTTSNFSPPAGEGASRLPTHLDSCELQFIFLHGNITILLNRMLGGHRILIMLNIVTVQRCFLSHNRFRTYRISIYLSIYSAKWFRTSLFLWEKYCTLMAYVLHGAGLYDLIDSVEWWFTGFGRHLENGEKCWLSVAVLHVWPHGLQGVELHMYTCALRTPTFGKRDTCVWPWLSACHSDVLQSPTSASCLDPRTNKRQ